MITMAFPFSNIPIEDYLLDSVRESIEEIDKTVEIETVVMTKDLNLSFPNRLKDGSYHPEIAYEIV